MLFGFSIKDLIDILLVALMLFYFYKLMKESGSLNLFLGIFVFLITWILVSRILDMRLLGGIMDTLVSVGALALIVLFQDEIRRFLREVGSQHRVRRILDFFTKKNEEKIDHAEMMPIVMACMNMSKRKEGALIVIEQGVKLGEIIKTGETINADINQLLIENIFFKNSPLHDGAMIICQKRIVAAGCLLPVSHSMDIPKSMGLRHRAALGVSQETDAIAVVVSEETGAITVAHRGTLHRRLTAEQLEKLLFELE
ncbi:MAG: diadenylate cyclase CdaA [Bacteroidaceae bacterium]|nr:diadenylate cyclase CdaA [Bacteroidaceae bacterium]MBR6600590.1 diadenylate cyclase CdaA [Bacteroidaceae bacterium]